MFSRGSCCFHKAGPTHCAGGWMGARGRASTWPLPSRRACTRAGGLGRGPEAAFPPGCSRAELETQADVGSLIWQRMEGWATAAHPGGLCEHRVRSGGNRNRAEPCTRLPGAPGAGGVARAIASQPPAPSPGTAGDPGLPPAFRGTRGRGDPDPLPRPAEQKSRRPAAASRLYHSAPSN